MLITNILQCTGQPLSPTENSPAQNISSAEAEKPGSRSRLEFCRVTLEAMFLHAKGLPKLLFKN